MRIVVNHLTRMQPGYICVAGIDLDSHRHVRPVLESGRLSTRLLRRERGPFEMAAVVDLGTVQAAGHPPETEDHRFNQWKARPVEDLAGPRFWQWLEDVARPSLGDIFGDALQLHDRVCTMAVGQGRASLGCLWVAGPRLSLDDAGKLRAGWNDGKYVVSAPVTDLRLYEADGQTPRRALVADLSKRLDAGVAVILSVGLTRPFLKPGDAAERHWLQVNNFHLADDPTWRDSAR